MTKTNYDPYRQVDVTRQPLQRLTSLRQYVLSGVIVGLLISYVLMTIGGFIVSLVSLQLHTFLATIAVLPFSHTIGVVWNIFRGWLWKVPIIATAVGVSVAVAYRTYRSKRLSSDDSGLNGYDHDMRLMLPEEMTNNFAIVPDCGVHFDENVTCILSHMMLNNHGIPRHAFAKHYDKDVRDENGEIIHYKDDIVYDQNGNVARELLPVFDKKLGDALFDLPNDPPVPKNKRIWYDPTKLLYNPKKRDHDRSGEQTVADKIKANWTFCDYELRRPAGIYVVSTKPQNTLVVAETRAGKGQRIIEPTLDLWSRQKEKCNIIINDPKGELLCRFYYPFVKRGFSVYAFNLINPNDSAIYNPLGYAAQACRMGRYNDENTLVKQLADVFFGSNNSSDKFWDNAAQSAFMQAAYGLIDYYMEEENEMRDRALAENWSASKLNNKLDELWGHVTLYNVYQMITVLAAKKSNDPAVISLDGDVEEQGKRGKDDTILYDSQGEPKEIDFLSLFFNASAELPMNGSRSKVMDAHHSLESVGGSDKTISTVYGVCVANLAIFADEPIKRMTSGRPSQNFDMKSLGAPRYFTIHLSKEWLIKHGLYDKEARCAWHCYRKPSDGKLFQERDLLKGKDFEHEAKMNDGWIEAAFLGIFPDKVAYLRCDITTPTGDVAYSFYFKFVKHYKRSMDGRSYVLEPATQERIIEGGSLLEMRLKHRKLASGKVVSEFVREDTMYTDHELDFSRDLSAVNDGVDVYKKVSLPVIDRKEVRYSEKTKVVAMIVPPQLTAYAPVLLIALDQMFNMNYQLALSLKPSGKPLVMTKYMLDELGNLKANGRGIKDYDTKLSIGLGQSQQFTSIYQAMQQVKDTNGETKDKTVEANTGEVVFLKSKDNDTLSFLEGMAGTKHQTVHDSRSITHHMFGNFNEMKANESFSVKEMPVITKADMLQIGDGDNMVFGKHNPIWSHNQLILPMAWKMLSSKQIHAPGVAPYSLSTVPTISHAGEFDLEHNMPDFYAMVKKRVAQARRVKLIEQQYKDLTGMTDADISRLEKDKYSRDIMRGVNESIAGLQGDNDDDVPSFDGADCDDGYHNADDNTTAIEEMNEHVANEKQLYERQFFNGTIALSDLKDMEAFVQGEWQALLDDTLSHYLVTNGRLHRLSEGNLPEMQLTYHSDCLYYHTDNGDVEMFAPRDDKDGYFALVDSGLTCLKILAQNSSAQQFDDTMRAMFGETLFNKICGVFSDKLKQDER